MLAKELVEAIGLLSDLIDRFMTVDLTGVGLIHSLYQARQRRQPGPMCMAAAELVAERLRGKGGPVAYRHRISGRRGRAGDRRSRRCCAPGASAVPRLRCL